MGKRQLLTASLPEAPVGLRVWTQASLRQGRGDPVLSSRELAPPQMHKLREGREKLSPGRFVGPWESRAVCDHASFYPKAALSLISADLCRLYGCPWL